METILSLSVCVGNFHNSVSDVERCVRRRMTRTIYGKKRRETKAKTRAAYSRDVNNLRRHHRSRLRRRRRRVIRPVPPGPRESLSQPIELPFGHPRFAATTVRLYIHARRRLA